MKYLKYTQIKDIFPDVYNFIKNNNLNELRIGRHLIDKDIYANVEIYNTKDRECCKFESHKRYIDIQMIISGEEKIIVNNISNLTISDNYDVNRDISFYYDNNEGNEYIINENNFLILYPEDAHMPSLNNGSSRSVKKIVFKVPLSINNNISYLFMDVDGTLTDGNIYIGNSGEMFKSFNIKDGYAIANTLKKFKIKPVIITGRESCIVLNRCKELGIKDIYQNINNKLEKLLQICPDLSKAAYIGDDIPDLECMKEINKQGGLTGCPFDSDFAIYNISSFISNKNGGNGAVRDFINWIVNNK